MSQIAMLRDRTLEAYLQDLLYDRGAAAGEIDQRRQELPYHPLLAEYRHGDEPMRDRLRRASLNLLTETAHSPWPLDPLGYLLTFLEEAAISDAIEPLKSVVNSGAWLHQSEGQQRQMLALRTLLGLGWLGDPQFWLDQDKSLSHAYPALAFRGLLQHGLEYAFSHMKELVRNPAQADKVLRLFPSLIQRYPLTDVKRETQRALADVSPEILLRFEEWFESRGYGPFSEEAREAQREMAKTADLSRELVRLAADLHAHASALNAMEEDLQAQALAELVRTEEEAAKAVLASYHELGASLESILRKAS
ncbi:MAG TPA: hypothetical protein VFE33_03805 [Thermoanaerobaculia bacterium]|nr:hypothetical protein [Thermoanaerobaculia bacterium]